MLIQLSVRATWALVWFSLEMSRKRQLYLKQNLTVNILQVANKENLTGKLHVSKKFEQSLKNSRPNRLSLTHTVSYSTPQHALICSIKRSI